MPAVRYREICDVLRFIRLHSVACVYSEQRRKIRRVECGSQLLPDGRCVPYLAIVDIDPTMQAARESLGY